ncbi:MAG TPA: glycosyltransferase family 2 protein [Candidatus Limnocylindrales bacterium]|nr:glycosyltransferase family 2 protein [Candidatus Limnocylindrales bacterium]
MIVHFGDPEPTRRCLDSLAGIDEVILVDQPPKLFGEHALVTTRIEPGANIGFAAACNRGVAATDAPFVLLLNNDAMLAPGSLEALRRALPGVPPDAAGACLKLLCTDDRTLQSAAGLWFTRDGIGFPHAFGETDRGQYDCIPDDRIGVPSGAAALYRTDCWREAGGMDENFFCYCEDGDLGLRMIAAGHRFAWLPEVRVLHELSSASGAHSLLKAYLVERNHVAAMIHTAPASALAAMPFVTFARLLRMGLDAARGNGAAAAITSASSPLEAARTLGRAWVDAIRMIPAAVAKRRAILARDRAATDRVSRFLASRQVSLAEFVRSRSAGTRPDE